MIFLSHCITCIFTPGTDYEIRLLKGISGTSTVVKWVLTLSEETLPWNIINKVDTIEKFQGIKNHLYHKSNFCSAIKQFLFRI